MKIQFTPIFAVVFFLLLILSVIIGGVLLTPPSRDSIDIDDEGVINDPDTSTSNETNNTIERFPFVFEGSIQQDNQEKYGLNFNGTKAWSHLVNQINIGFRFPGSPEIEQTRKYIVSELHLLNWEIKFHNFTYNGVHVSNILAFPANTSHNDVILFGAHYDTRFRADKDPNNKTQHVLGANDGASGVAMLLELARVYHSHSGIALLFIDAEDQGGINGWDWIVGSTEFAKPENLDNYFPNGKDSIEAFVLFDMIGDWNLNIINEGFSSSSLKQEIWFAAAVLDYSNNFTNSLDFITDDHRPFIDVGIPAIDLTDFGTGLYVDENNNNLHHTARDTLEYVSEESLWIVGQTIEYWFNART